LPRIRYASERRHSDGLLDDREASVIFTQQSERQQSFHEAVDVHRGATVYSAAMKASTARVLSPGLITLALPGLPGASAI
jgi:hypothetical protein